MTKKDLIIALASDIAMDFCYYDRKNCEQLSVAELEEAINSGEVTVSEIVNGFAKTLKEAYPNSK